MRPCWSDKVRRASEKEVEIVHTATLATTMSEAVPPSFVVATMLARMVLVGRRIRDGL